jgi:hypothetical protein
MRSLTGKEGSAPVATKMHTALWETAQTDGFKNHLTGWWIWQERLPLDTRRGCHLAHTERHCAGSRTFIAVFVLRGLSLALFGSWPHTSRRTDTQRDEPPMRAHCNAAQAGRHGWTDSDRDTGQTPTTTAGQTPTTTTKQHGTARSTEQQQSSKLPGQKKAGFFARR